MNPTSLQSFSGKIRENAQNILASNASESRKENARWAIGPLYSIESSTKREKATKVLLWMIHRG